MSRYRTPLIESALMHPSGYQADPVTGVVYSIYGKPVRRTNVQGYLRTSTDIPAHRIVWEAVHGQVPDGMEINHINGIKTDNRIVNLEAVTHAENVRHARRIGLTPPSRGRAKVTEDDVRAIRARRAAGESRASIAADYGIARITVSDITRGKNWSHVK